MNADIEDDLSKSTTIRFHPAGDRPAALYASATAVCEEGLEHGRWIGLYWSATGHVHRENVVSDLQGLPVHLDATLTSELVIYTRV